MGEERAIFFCRCGVGLQEHGLCQECGEHSQFVKEVKDKQEDQIRESWEQLWK
jgi:hypothetical protein